MCIMVNGQKVVTLEDVALDSGYAYNTVVNIMSAIKRNGNYSKKCAEKVLASVEKLGYDATNAKNAGYYKSAKTNKAKGDVTRARKEEEHRLDYLRKHNFESKAAETMRMKYLREQGYTNLEISEAIGRSYMCVLNRIGYQPDEYTEESMKMAGETRRRKNEARRTRTVKAKAAARLKEIAALEAANKEAHLRIVARNEEIERTNKLNAEELAKIEENTRRLEELKAGA